MTAWREIPGSSTMSVQCDQPQCIRPVRFFLRAGLNLLQKSGENRRYADCFEARDLRRAWNLLGTKAPSHYHFPNREDPGSELKADRRIF